MTKTKVKPSRSVAKQLRDFFRRNGYVRRQSAVRRDAEGYSIYKKGDEVRLAAVSNAELRQIRRLLRQAGFVPGKPFRKGKQWRQPLYGRAVVAQFLEMIKDVDRPRSRTGARRVSRPG